MASYKAIMALVFEGRSYEQIVGMVGCSRRDVSLVKKTVAARGLTATQTASMSEAQWAQLFPDGRRNMSESSDQPDFSQTLKSMKINKHFTLQQAWRMYVGAPSGQGKKYGYSRYCQLFAEFAATHDVVATLHHEPGRALLVDFGVGFGHRGGPQGLPVCCSPAIFGAGVLPGLWRHEAGCVDQRACAAL